MTVAFEELAARVGAARKPSNDRGGDCVHSGYWLAINGQVRGRFYGVVRQVEADVAEAQTMDDRNAVDALTLTLERHGAVPT